MFRIILDLRTVLLLFVASGLFLTTCGYLKLSYVSFAWYFLVVLGLLVSIVLSPIRVPRKLNNLYARKDFLYFVNILFVLSSVAWIRFVYEIFIVNGAQSLIYLRSPEYALEGVYDDTFFNIFSRMYLFTIIFHVGRRVNFGTTSPFYYILLFTGLAFSLIMMTRAPIISYFCAIADPILMNGKVSGLFRLFILALLAVFGISGFIEGSSEAVFLYAFGGFEALGSIIDGAVLYSSDSVLSLEPLYYIGSKMGLTDAIDYVRDYTYTSLGKTNVYTFFDSLVIDFGSVFSLVFVVILAVIYGLVYSLLLKTSVFNTFILPITLYMNLMVFMNNEYLRSGFWISSFLLVIVSFLLRVFHGWNSNS